MKTRARERKRHQIEAAVVGIEVAAVGQLVVVARSDTGQQWELGYHDLFSFVKVTRVRISKETNLEIVKWNATW